MNESVALLGYGIEGQSTLRRLRRQGINPAHISILDASPDTSVPDDVQAHLENKYLETLESYDHIFISPGITQHRLLEQSSLTTLPREKITNQTQVFFDRCTLPIIGVTGTKGKSTTVSLITHMLEHTGMRVLLAGNVGTPVLDYIDDLESYDIVVYELSSYQLEALHDFSLDIGVFTSLYSAHTQEHGGYDTYVHAKQKLLAASKTLFVSQQAAELLENLPVHAQMYGATGTYHFTENNFYAGNTVVGSDADMLLVGLHNRHNACVLRGIADTLDIDHTHIAHTLQHFSALEHRLEYVGTYNNILRYNDAIATTPQATMAAIDSFGDRVDTLLYG